MIAKDIRPGDVFADDTGQRRFAVVEAKPSRGFIMGLEGHPDKPAIMVFWKGLKGDYTLFHPDEDVGEPLKRATETKP